MDADRARRIAGTAAASPTTRASTRSTCRRWPTCSPSAARLGFNAKYLIEMGEETGSPGLREVCEANRELFKADLLIASDGPRLRADRPTIFLGSRGNMNFDLTIEARKGGAHSGNWGGLISNPGTAARARDCEHRITDRTDTRARVGAERITGVGATRARRLRSRRRPRRAEDRAIVGRARTHAGRASVRLVLVRSARLQDRQSGHAGQRDSAARVGALSTSFRCRHRSEEHPAGAAQASRPTGIFDGEDRTHARRDVPRDADRSRRSVGAMGDASRLRAPAARSRRCCRTSAVRCRTTSSPTCSDCAPCGYRIRIRDARSTHRTNICRRKFCAKRSP